MKKNMCLTLQYLLFGIKKGRSFFLNQGSKRLDVFHQLLFIGKYFVNISFLLRDGMGLKPLFTFRKIFQQAMAENINTLFLFQFHVSLSYIIQYITFQKSNGRLTCCLQRDLLVARNEIMSSRLTTAVFQTEKNPHRSE